ncbi:DUF58 domain-containing protein [Marinicella sp. S1101]|uniref:DUF58 domain-containing protein n=1 Tax=Marinicella marina TaxID=2996016 RepID=UPI002260AD6A|nr:DUF58 domain-containing protein [Marinicella marina]MCX7552897.1 DUF58 domain-containing protein [Marinicella marina]MDJ1139794.1 DUF58 domain-containing protein [Marinicella marina]
MIRQLFKQKLNQFFNRRGIEPLPVVFDWRRIYVLPSKAGLFFATIWFLMMLAGLNFNNNMTLMLVFLLFGLAQVVLHQTFFNIRNLRLEQVSAEPVFMGDAIVLHIQIGADNEKWQIRTENKLSSDIDNITQEVTQLKSMIESQHRGWHSPGRIKFLSRYPMGLFTCWVYCTPKAQVLVYPKPESPCPPFPQHGGQDGEKSTPVKGEELSSIRAYQQGDPIRDIAWKKTAQSNQTWVKDFHQTQGQHLLFDFAQMAMSNTEAKLSRLTAWILEAENQGADYQLLMPGFDSGMSSGDVHKHQCLKSLALYDFIPKSGGVS